MARPKSGKSRNLRFLVGFGAKPHRSLVSERR